MDEHGYQVVVHGAEGRAGFDVLFVRRGPVNATFLSWRTLAMNASFKMLFATSVICLVFGAEGISQTASSTKRLERQGLDAIKNLEIDFTGLYLGCTMDELKNALEGGGMEVALENGGRSDGITDYYCEGNYKLKSATASGYSFWQGRLISAVVLFNGDKTDGTYNTLKKLVEEKYGEASEEITSDGKECVVNKDGIRLCVTHLVSGSRGPRTTFSCLHEQMVLLKEGASLNIKRKP